MPHVSARGQARWWKKVTEPKKGTTQRMSEKGKVPFGRVQMHPYTRTSNAQGWEKPPMGGGRRGSASSLGVKGLYGNFALLWGGKNRLRSSGIYC